jgi:hypothetical protein
MFFPRDGVGASGARSGKVGNRLSDKNMPEQGLEHHPEGARPAFRKIAPEEIGQAANVLAKATGPDGKYNVMNLTAAAASLADGRSANPWLSGISINTGAGKYSLSFSMYYAACIAAVMLCIAGTAEGS